MIFVDIIALAWIALASLVTFLLFAFDKNRARKIGRRISEYQLMLASAAGGWLGGLIAMCLFRHKTAKRTFHVKFGFAFIVFASAIAAYLYWRTKSHLGL